MPDTLTGTLTTKGDADRSDLVLGSVVRRLTPRECERVMGYPDDHTRWGLVDGKVVEIADSHRYKGCGNGVVAPVAEWIGRRLVEVAA